MNTSKLIGFFAIAIVAGAAVLTLRGVQAKSDKAPDLSPAPAPATQTANAQADDPRAGHDMSAKPEAKPEATLEESTPVSAPKAVDTKTVGTLDPIVLADGTIDLQNTHCPVMGGKAQKDVTKTIDGVVVHYCCPGCDSTMEKDSAKYFKKLGIDDIDAFKKSVAEKKTAPGTK